MSFWSNCDKSAKISPDYDFIIKKQRQDYKI